MSKNAKLGIGVIIVVIILALLWMWSASSSPSASQTAPTSYAPATDQVQTQPNVATNNGLSMSPQSDTTSAALDTDLTSIDSQMTALSVDSATIDNGISAFTVVTP